MEENNVMTNEVEVINDVEVTDLATTQDSSKEGLGVAEGLVLGFAAVGVAATGAAVVKGVKWVGGKAKATWNGWKEKRAEKKAAKEAPAEVEEPETEVVETEETPVEEPVKEEKKKK